ncbi:MAG: hypothetical protein AAFV45_15680 [Pseudomonadota bacterium]
MTSPYFQQYTNNLKRVLMAEFVDDMQNGGNQKSRQPQTGMTTTVEDFAHLLPPFPMISGRTDALET